MWKLNNITMKDLLTRVKCPMGCQNSIFTERTKVVSNPNTNLLQETGTIPAVQRVKVYTCQCCGKSFEMSESQGRSDGKMIL